MALRYNDKTKSTNFTPEHIVFGDVKKFTIPATFSRIPITYNYPDGERKLSVKIPETLSWGIQENRNKQTDKIESYAFSFVLFDFKMGPTPEEKATIDMLDTICECIKNHLMSEPVKEALNIWDKDNDISRMSIMYRKKERGKVVEGLAPTIYPKLLTKYEKTKSDKPPEITTGFYDAYDEMIEPSGLIGVRCKAVGAVVVDSIYIGGGRFSIQLKLNDVIVMKQFKGPTRLLESSSSTSYKKSPAANFMIDKMKLISSVNDRHLSDEASDDDDDEAASSEKKEIIIYKRKPNKDQS